jgi:SnoaL-like domain
METHMSDLETIIDTYLAAYGEPDPTRRRQLIEQSWTAGGTLADPPMDATGHDALDAMFAAVQGQFPGHTFRRTSAVDAHHRAARYTWDLVTTDGSITVSGTDFARFADDNRLEHVTGFFGPIPEL